MLSRIVKTNRSIEVCPTFRDISHKEQGAAHEAMPDHERNRVSLFLGARQELRREIETDVAVECYFVSDPKTVEDREQQQRVFGSLSKCFSLFDQQACPLFNRLGLRSSMSFDMDKWGY